MLDFNEAAHRYSIDGRVIPSVTQVLEPLQRLEGVPADLLERARVFGSHVHLACHLYNTGELDEATLDADLAPYLDGWKQFLRDTQFKVRGSEQRVYAPDFDYAGTVDVVGSWHGSDWIIDLKSGAVPSTVGAQIAAYRHALNPRPRNRLCLQLRHGTYRMHVLRDQGDFPLFLSALNCWKFLNRRQMNVPEHA